MKFDELIRIWGGSIGDGYNNALSQQSIKYIATIVHILEW